MKFSGVAFALAAFTAGAASQSLSGLPSCAISCATDSIPKDCGIDPKCICSAQSFITGVSCCVAKACNAADQETSIKYADKICAGVGVTNLPTSAVCSSAASATGTQSAAGTGTGTSTGTSTATATSAGASSTTGSATATAASPSGTNAAASFVKADGSVTAGVMVAAVFAAMCLA